MTEQTVLDIDQTLLPWIGKSMKAIDYFMMDRFSEHGIELTKVQWILLKRLRNMNGEPQHHLAFLTNRDKASLTRLLTTMESKNLVARVPSGSDQRINQIFITSHGEKIFQKSIPVVKGMIEEMQQGLTEEERKMTIRVLKKLMKNISTKDCTVLETK
jgi:DNA-binding MarR family transcriptional regulator